MSHDAISRLRRIAALQLELRLARLKAASQATAATREALTTLDAAGAAARSAEWVDPRAAERFQAWVGGRRGALNMTLAQQFVAQEKLRGEAARAFGQNEALRRIEERRRDALRLARFRRS